MKTSINRIQVFIDAASHFKSNNPKEEKIISILDRMLPELNRHYDEYWKLHKNIQLAHANTDKNGSLLYENGSEGQRFAYTRDGYLAAEEKLKALANEDRFEVDPIYLPEVPESLNQNYRKAFEGFIIKPTEVEEEE